jgi:hypothetical protein
MLTNFFFYNVRFLILCRANKLRAEVQLPSMQADDSWLRYFENAFDKAAKVRMFFVCPRPILKLLRACSLQHTGF